jgi:hypothetical protein
MKIENSPAKRIKAIREIYALSRHRIKPTLRMARNLSSLIPAALLNPPRVKRDANNPGTLYLDNFNGLVGYRSHEDASKAVPYIIRHNGWYTDGSNNDTLIPVVVTVRDKRARNMEFESEYRNPKGSHVWYYAATRHSDWDGVTVYTDELSHTAREAALRADRIAKIEAENCRDEDARYQADAQIIDLKVEIHEINREALPLIREIKQNPTQSAPICLAVRKSLESLLRDRTAKFERISELQDSPWLAVDY